MLKRVGKLLIIFGIVGAFIAINFANKDLKNVILIGISVSFASAFLGLAFLVIHAEKAKQYKYKTILLAISILLFAVSLLSAYLFWPGTNWEKFLAIFCYCFGYAPIELYHKNEKWRAYSNNTWEILVLSSIDFIGINLILMGILTHRLHWPGQNYLVYPGIGLLLGGVLLWNSRFKKEVMRRKASEDMIKSQYLEIKREKEISENLLLNILPAEVAEELKAKGSADAKLFDEVTVLFTDFKNFTQISEKMSPTELVEELNIFFKAFDEIMTGLNIEKIKTIGDSYMCVGGLPIASPSHAEDVVKAALEIQKFVETHSLKRLAEGKVAMQIRIGIHSGPVVAGIVGVKKYAYDIWGDTVNTASRMESSGEAGKVNISYTTFELVKDKFKCIPRGMVMAKNKGEMEMYFVEGECDI